MLAAGVISRRASTTNPLLEAVYRYVYTHLARFVEELKALPRICSVAGHQSEVARAAEFLHGYIAHIEEARLQARLPPSAAIPCRRLSQAVGGSALVAGADS